MSLSILELVLSVVLAVGTVVGAVLTIHKQRRKTIDELESQHNVELASLASTRKEIIDELRAEMVVMQDKHNQEVSALRSEIAELRGQYIAMRNFQAQEVIEGVVAGVLRGLDPGGSL